jgi:hypothetical protein
VTDEELAATLALVAINGIARAAGEDEVTEDEWRCAAEENDEAREECEVTRRQVIEAVGLPLVAKLRELGWRPPHMAPYVPMQA